MASSSASLRSKLLRSSLPLVKTYGFTRESLARSVLSLHSHKDPLSDRAVSSLFGHGDDARRTLIQAWLDEGIRSIREMGEHHHQEQWPQQQPQQNAKSEHTLSQVLHARLTYNEPVLPHIPEAFALLVSPSAGIVIPPFDPLPALQHVAQIANEACYAVSDKSLYLAWYTNRVSVAALYTAAELHQLASPTTAHAFLDSLLESSDRLKKSAEVVETYSEYLIRSWAGIIKSSGVI